MWAIDWKRHKPSTPQTNSIERDIVFIMNWRIIAFAIVLCAMCAAKLPAQSCEGLAKLSSPTASILSAKSVLGGEFAPAAGGRAIESLPSFCRVIVQVKPTTDSDIDVEVWLPTANWNGKYMAVGSGGWGGSIAYEAMAEALRRGYATSATDDGHKGASGSFVLGHSEKLVDFAYRAEHEMTMQAKALIKAFYGKDAHYSYWNGCSGGGREGLLQAARYPDEFDGVIAGDPANIRRNAWAMWLAVKTFKDPADAIPASKYAMIHRAVLNACDGKDGLKDGLIEDPESCTVDFKALECKAEDRPDCLTVKQVKTAETIVSPAMTTSGEILFPRLEPGTEMRWARLAGGPDPGELFWDEFRYVVYQDSNWDWKAFELERDAARAHAIDKDVDELQPNLSEFAKHGGKLLIYHGWADQQVAPGSSVEFYKSAIAESGNGSDWIRLFMLPGMGHCSGGEGPDRFDKIAVMDDWVEHAKIPDQILTSHMMDGKVDRTRPACAYPQIAKYKGSGNVDNANNFVCGAK
jgi:feruloyl esterase